jgi:hypothetical protein
MKTRILLLGFIFFALVSCGVQNIRNDMKPKLPSVEIRLNYEKKSDIKLIEISPPQKKLWVNSCSDKFPSV